MQRLICCGLFLATLASAQADAAATKLCAAVAPAITGELKAGAAQPLPKAEVLARIAVAAPGTAALDAAKVLQIEHAWPEDESAEGRLACVPVGDDSGRMVVLIAAGDRTFRGGAVLGKDGTLVANMNAFANQFAGKAVPKLDGAVTRAAAAKVLAELEGGKDAAQKASAALIDVRRQMLHQSAPIGSIMTLLEHGKAPSDADVTAARGPYQALQARAAEIAPAVGKGAKDYAASIDGVLKALDQIAGAGDEGKRKAVHALLKRDCRTCHQLESDRWQGAFEDFAQNERRRLGLGERVFLVGYDVLPAGVDAADAQKLADAMYRAALLLDATLP